MHASDCPLSDATCEYCSCHASLFYTDESDESLAAMMRQLAAGQQRLLELIPSLPSTILEALAPVIRPLSYHMSNMSGSRLRDALTSSAITLTRRVLPRHSRLSVLHFCPYNWRPGCRAKDLGEDEASAGEPPEFSTSSTQQRRRAASSSASRAALLPHRGRTVSESRTSSASTHSAPFTRAMRTAVNLSAMGTDDVPGVIAPPVLHQHVSLLSHLEQNVPTDILATRVIFADAQRAPLELPYTLPSLSSIQHVTVTGHPDAAVFHPDSAAPVNRVAHDLSLALLLFDWKTPTAMLPCDASGIEGQLCSEALAFRNRYGYSVPVVATDLCSAIRVWRFDGSILSEILSEDRTPLTLQEGMGIVWDLIREQIPVVGEWLSAQAATRPSPAGGDGGASGADADADAGSDTPGAREVVGAARGTGTGAGRSTCLGGTKGSSSETFDDTLAPDAYGPCSETDLFDDLGQEVLDTSGPCSETDLYDDLEQEVLAQKLSMVWRSSPSLCGLAARIAAASDAVAGCTAGI